MNNVMVLPTASDAFLELFAPIACPTTMVVPIANPMITTVSICITCEPMLTAVMLATPQY